MQMSRRPLPQVVLESPGRIGILNELLRAAIIPDLVRGLATLELRMTWESEETGVTDVVSCAPGVNDGLTVADADACCDPRFIPGEEDAPLGKGRRHNTRRRRCCADRRP